MAKATKNNRKDVTIGFTAGIISGWGQVLIMQPFQIIKVRLQTQLKSNQQKYFGTIDCLKKIITQEGFSALYKGTLSPLLGIGIQTSLQFGLNEFNKKWLDKFNKNPNQPMPFHLVGISGLLAGLGTALASTPVQHTRIRIQIQNSAANKIYSGSMNAMARIWKNYGIRGLYVGFIPTLLRDGFGSAFYFTGYQLVMRNFSANNQRPLSISLLAGGIAGMCYWGVMYPIDYLKTQMQTDNLGNRKYKGLWDTFTQKKQDGIRSFYKGFHVCMLRAFPVNAGGFFIFQTAMQILQRQQLSF